jgi:hypothetical protein
MKEGKMNLYVRSVDKKTEAFKEEAAKCHGKLHGISSEEITKSSLFD